MLLSLVATSVCDGVKAAELTSTFNQQCTTRNIYFDVIAELPLILL